MSSILLVEDDPNARTGLCEILEDEGYDVETAPDAATALDKSGRERFDLLLADYRLPDLSGVELHARVCSMHPETQTIIMTAYEDPEGRAQAEALGIAAWFTKPIDLPRLSNSIRAALNRAREPAPTLA